MIAQTERIDEERWTFGLDLGGTGTRAVALASDGSVLAQHLLPTPVHLERGSAVSYIEDIENTLAQPNPPVSIGIGASGPIDADGIIRNPDTLPAFTGLTLVDDLRNRFEVPVVIDNDAVTAAVAEHRIGAARAQAAFLHVTLGTGVGVCLLTESGPFRGSDGTHPEAGHFSLGVPTRSCYCGRRNCFEQGASRAALQRAAATHLGRAVDDPLAIEAAHRAAQLGDRAAADIFDLYSLALADGLSTLISTYRPPLIVLGGSAVRAYDSIKPGLARYLAVLHIAPLPPIATTALDDYGGAIGAAHLAQ